MFCLRKAYPYNYKALQYQEYFTGEQTNPNTSQTGFILIILGSIICWVEWSNELVMADVLP